MKAGTKRIAVQVELSWPRRPHMEMLAGLREYARTKGDWVVEDSRFPEVRMANGVAFDGLVGRIEPTLYDVVCDAAPHEGDMMPLLVVVCPGTGKHDIVRALRGSGTECAVGKKLGGSR